MPQTDATPIPPLGRPPDHAARMAVARRWAAWELGSPDWADHILAAYMAPEQSTADLDSNEAPHVD